MDTGADISTPDFPGIYARDQGFVGPRPNPESHPHMRLGKTMVSVPKVNPGDTVFWHSVRSSKPFSLLTYSEIPLPKIRRLA